MLHPSAWSFQMLILLLGLTFGATCHWMWTHHRSAARRRIPKHWPVNSRRIVNANEGEVWRFLVKTFPDHAVMVKLPFTRFTMPQGEKHKLELFEHLSKVYCTFTVSTRDGRIIGCVDVGGRKTVSRSNQLLKLSLLSQCDICYWAVENNGQLRADQLRAYFLDADQPSSKPAFSSAQTQLRDVVERQRQQRRSQGEGPSSSGGFSHSDLDSGSWQTADSFIAPLETRPGALQ